MYVALVPLEVANKSSQIFEVCKSLNFSTRFIPCHFQVINMKFNLKIGNEREMW